MSVKLQCLCPKTRITISMAHLNSIVHLTLAFSTGCKVNADIIFLLDISGSITTPDLEKVVDFETQFVQNLNIGPDNDRVGTVLFGRHAYEVFNFSSYQDRDDVLAAVRGVYNFTLKVREGDKYLPTNMAAGLCSVWNSFKSDERDSTTVFRIAIVMSDGLAQDHNLFNDCNNWTTSTAASEIHQLIPPVFVYVIGISNFVDEDQLRSITTAGSHYFHLDNFDLDSLRNVGESLLNDICWKGKTTLTMPPNSQLDVYSVKTNVVVSFNLQLLLT